LWNVYEGEDSGRRGTRYKSGFICVGSLTMLVMIEMRREGKMGRYQERKHQQAEELRGMKRMVQLGT
jgi:hypothetical protein